METPRLRIRPAQLRRIRLEKALDREQLAQLSGISKKRIEQIENGYAGVKPKTARALASALECAVEDLIEVTTAAAAGEAS